MYNLNPRYKMLNDDINYVKNQIFDMDYDQLFDLCPRITIPKGTLFYHSTKYSANDISNIDNKLYPKKNNCQQCYYKDSIPKENIGDKPRIMELSSNPNMNVKGKCICNTGQQERLYGNFNFAGNYNIVLGKTVLKGTEILINDMDMTLIDLNYLSIELGFSPKKFYIDNVDSGNEFGKQRYWQSYCKKNKLDGIIMIDIVDVQFIDISHKTSLSCYTHITKNTRGVACPEFALIAPIGAKMSKYPIGTEKLKILGMVDLYDDIDERKLSREEAEMLFEIFFDELHKMLSKVTNQTIDINLLFNNFTLFKALQIKKNNTVLSVDELFKLLFIYIDTYGSDDLYVNINKTYNLEKYNIYKPDILYLNTYEKTQLELFEPVEYNPNVELYTEIIINNILPKNQDNYYFKNGELVTRYASDQFFDYILKNLYKNNYNTLLLVNYHLLSSIDNYNMYTMDYYAEKIYTIGKTNINNKHFIDKLESDIVVNFYLHCYLLYNNLNDNDIETKDFLNDLYYQMKLYMQNKNFDYTLFRNKTWQQFKTAYLTKPEKYVCHFNFYNDIISQTVSYNNFMVIYLYNILTSYGYELDPLDFILDNVKPSANVDFLIYYTTMPDIDDIYDVYKKWMDNMYSMDI